MAKVSVINLKGEKIKDLTISDSIWNIEVNNVVLYDAIKFARAALRQGTAKTKTRGEVSGGGRKPWKQKGTGRARQGSIRSPQWIKGGIVFGPTPRDYSKKQNKKEKRLALLSALSYKYQNKNLVVVDNFNLETNKTKEFVDTMKKIKIGKSIIITNGNNDNLLLASRNIKNVLVVSVDKINTLEISSYRTMIIEENSVKTIEEVLK